MRSAVIYYFKMDLRVSSYYQMSLTNLFNNRYFSEIYPKILESKKNLSLDIFKQRIFSQFQVNLENLFETEFILNFKCNIAIETIDNLEFYRFQYYIKYYQEYLDRENKKQQEEQDSMNKKNNIFNASNLMKDSKKMLGNPSMKMPTNLSNLK